MRYHDTGTRSVVVQVVGCALAVGLACGLIGSIAFASDTDDDYARQREQRQYEERQAVERNNEANRQLEQQQWNRQMEVQRHQQQLESQKPFTLTQPNGQTQLCQRSPDSLYCF